MELLSYIINSLRFPNRRDYLRMSAGIRSRSKRCRSYWRRHLELSRHFISSSMAHTDSAAIYGAGSLLDINCSILDDSLKSLILVDIDPTLKNIWIKSFPKLKKTNSLNCQVFDVTGVMDKWSKLVRKAKDERLSIEDMARVLDELTNTETTRTGAIPDCAVSLNLLGQLGVYWRDRVVSILSADKYYFESDGVLLPALEESLQRSVRLLERSHLELLAKFKKVVLLTDIYYFYYKESESLWQTEEALTISSETISIFFKDLGFKSTNTNSWLWHIAPQKIENPDYGEIHEVRAFFFER